MHECTIVKKDGTVISGSLWALNRSSWCIEVSGSDETGQVVHVPLADCASAIERDARETAATVGQDADLLARARKWGWAG